MKQAHFTFAAYHRIIIGISQHHKIGLEGFCVCLLNAKASNIPHGKCQQQLRHITLSFHTGVTFAKIY